MEPQLFRLDEHPHRRFNPFTGEWILVSPHRATRPWQGFMEPTLREDKARYDPTCYLCPGNERAGGVRNPDYTHTFVFDNDFTALLLETPPEIMDKKGLLVAQGEPGVCRVVCFSPRHDLTLADMEHDDIRRVVDTWIVEYRTLSEHPLINYVQIFENKGEVMGCSNPHPHCQIWAERSIPVEPIKELTKQREYLVEKKTCLLCDYLEVELSEGVRLVCTNESFVALVPFWAVWPFETMVIPRRHIGTVLDLSEQEKNDFADILKHVTKRYDNLFGVSFPYSAGMHQTPCDAQPYPEMHLHMHFLPPLLRSASIKKFMVGYEMLANPQRDMTPEASAKRLRALQEG